MFRGFAEAVLFRLGGDTMLAAVAAFVVICLDFDDFVELIFLFFFRVPITLAVRVAAFEH
jgi:hypothetical protein